MGMWEGQGMFCYLKEHASFDGAAILEALICFIYIV